MMKRVIFISILLLCFSLYWTATAHAADFLGANVEDREVPTVVWRAGVKGVKPIVNNVPSGSLAAQTGLRQGDVIIKVGESLAGRAAYLQNYTSAATSVTVLRGTERVALTITNKQTLRAEKENSTNKNEHSIFVHLGHSKYISSVAFSADGRLALSGSSDNTVKLWDILNNKDTTTFVGHTAGVNTVAFSPNGKFALSGSDDNTIKLWDIITGKNLKTLIGHKDKIETVAFTTDGRYVLSASNDRTIKLWDVYTGNELHTFAGHSDAIRSAVLSPDGAFILSSSADSTIKLWDVSSGKELRTYRKDNCFVHSVDFSPDGKSFLSASSFKQGAGAFLELWDVATGNVVKKFLIDDWGLSSMKFLPDGLKAISTGEKTILWDIRTAKKLKSFDESSMVGTSAISPDSSSLMTPGDNNPKILNLKSGDVTFLGNITIAVTNAIPLLDGTHLVSGSRLNTPFLWDIVTGKRVKAFTEAKESFEVRLSPDGSNIITSSKGGKIRLININTGKIFSTLNTESNLNEVSEFSSDGRYILSEYSNEGWIEEVTKTLWDVKYGKKIRSIKEKAFSGGIFVLSSDGRHVLSEKSKGTLKYWDITTNKELKTFKHSEYPINTVSLSSDGHYALSGTMDEGNIKIWEISSGKLIQKFTGHPGGVNSAIFSPNGKYVLSGGYDNYISLWDVATGNEVGSIDSKSGVRSVKYTQDGHYIISTGSDDTIRLWNSQNGEMLVQLVSFIDGEWIAITSEGYFNASPNAAKYLNVLIDGKTYEIDQFFSHFYRPDLVEAKIAGKDISSFVKSINFNKILTEGGVPPKVHFLTKSGNADNYDTSIRAQVCDTGGGIGDVTLFLNDMPVAVETAGRGLKVVEKNRDGQCYSFERTITLSPGANSIQLMAYNKANTIESHRDTIEINHTAKAAQPELHLLTVAVNAYRDGDLRLKYALPDADAVAELVQAKGKGLFNKVHIHTLRDGDVTREGLAQKFASIGSKMKREDVFLLFVAGHGITDEKEGAYYFLPADFRYTGEGAVQKQAVSMTDFRNMLANVQAMKSLILLDTCNSGSFAEAIASRGMTEKTAITKLSRAVGRATIVASSKSQVALEGYEGHGAFTWTILEGMKGKATDKGSKITINSLATFIEEELPKLTFKKWGYEQIPQKTLQGMDFQIGVR